MNFLKKIKEYREHIFQFFKFNLVGLMNTAVDIGIFAVLITLGMYYLVAQVISYSLGVVNSYAWNKYWTFKKKTAVNGSEAVKFIFVNMVSLGVATIFIYIFHDNAGLSMMTSKILATGFSLIVNFAGNKFWVFREVPAPVPQEDNDEITARH